MCQREAAVGDDETSCELAHGLDLHMRVLPREQSGADDGSHDERIVQEARVPVLGPPGEGPAEEVDPRLRASVGRPA